MDSSVVYEPTSVFATFLPFMKSWYLAYYFGAIISFFTVAFELVATILRPESFASYFPSLVVTTFGITGTTFVLVKCLKAPTPLGLEETPPLKQAKVHFAALLVFASIWIAYGISFVLGSIFSSWTHTARVLFVPSYVLSFVIAITYLLGALSLKGLAANSPPSPDRLSETAEGGHNRPSQGQVSTSAGAIKL